MEDLLIWVILIIVAGIVVAMIVYKKNPEDDSSEAENRMDAGSAYCNEEPMPLYFIDESKVYTGKKSYSDAEIWTELSNENAAYIKPVFENDPINYPRTKCAVSRMTEADRNAYHRAVADLKERIQKGLVPVCAFYQARNLEKYSASLLARAQKKGEIEKARNCAANLFYSKVCTVACYTDTGTAPEMDLWLRDYGVICMNLTYFRLGIITGKRGSQDFKELWAGDYERIAAALDPDRSVVRFTNWRDVRSIAEELKD